MMLSPSHFARRLFPARFGVAGFTLAALATVSSLLAGCGYHTVGSSAHLPPNIRTIAVPVFATHVLAYHTEMALTQAVVRELDTRTNRRVLTANTGDADAVLSGTVLTQTNVPLTYDSSSGETSSYVVTITVKVVLTARDGRVLYRNDALSYREQYQSTQDLSGFIREDPSAVNRLARNFAQALVSDMMESF
jgi:outer membrane lipopolysaccharide assembly protein LptE/RlpB